MFVVVQWYNRIVTQESNKIKYFIEVFMINKDDIEFKKKITLRIRFKLEKAMQIEKYLLFVKENFLNLFSNELFFTFFISIFICNY